MNYSIIFTEISFSPETSILLQIIRIIHITLWIMPEFTGEGGQSVSSGSKVANHNEYKSHPRFWGDFQVKKKCDLYSNKYNRL